MPAAAALYNCHSKRSLYLALPVICAISQFQNRLARAAQVSA